MIFFRIFEHLLPRARAWRITVEKNLRSFFEGLSGLGADIKLYIDQIWQDIDPQLTRELTAWEHQFNLPDNGLTEQQRRDRLDASWKALGGQSPRYLQDTLQQNGFNVFVHEWWEPGSEPGVGVKACATARNPLLVLRRNSTTISYFAECGEVGAECGEVLAECGNSLDPIGYPLVNKVFETTTNLTVLCGETGVECGEVDAVCGNFTDFESTLKNYVVPTDPTKWPYFLYYGGEVYGQPADIQASRRDEFEALCLKISPAQNWLGIIVNYV